VEKYKNQDGIALNYEGDDSHKVLVREVVGEAIRILSTYQMNSPQSMMWAMQRCEDFLRINFNLVEQIELDEMELISQFNRNRAPEDWVDSMDDMQQRIKEINDDRNDG